MNFSQLHERLRLELLRRIQRGTVSVSLLARQTGFAQAHLSNFLHSRRHLSLQSMDRVLAAQQLTLQDLISADPETASATGEANPEAVPVVSHAVALFEPFVRAAAVHSTLHVPTGYLQSLRSRAPQPRRAWQRFVAVHISSAESLAMEPLVLPDALVLLDRHYISLHAYLPSRPTLYAVRHGAHLRLRYADFQLNRLVLRPLNMAFAVELVEVAPGEAPGDLIAGRVAMIVNRL